MTESINQCIKLSAENKINIKNAFSLEMIDFMTYMIKKQDANMSNLQVASTSLDVSTKIYGYRVDSVHMEILKMVGGLDKKVIDNMEQNSEEQEETMQENAEANVETQKKKKRKKTKQKITTTVESLKGNIEIMKPMSTMIGEGDLQTSDMLYQATLPNHANSGFYLHPYNDVFVDVLEDTSKSQSNSNIKYTISAIEDFSNLEICKSYPNFEFLGWSVDDEPEEMPEEEIESNDDNSNRFQFDLDASVEHDDPAPEPMNYFDIEHDDDQNNVQACFQKTANRPEANVVEVHNGSGHPEVRTSEYSFVQPSMSLHWAGPSHWKFWNFARSSTATSTNVVACMQAKLRKKKQFELLYDETRDIVDAKFASSQSIKLQAKTAKAEWSAKSLTLPEDVHYDIAQLNKLYLYQKAMKSANKEKEDENVTAADVSDGERYDYNNPNDTLEYCPNVEHDDDYDDYGNRDDCNFEDNAVALNSQGLTGDNLVAAPKLVNKISIAYCLKAKKIDMRQLKKSIWNCLKSTNNNAANIVDRETVDETMKESKQFSDVYKMLPKLLTKSNAEALSVPISFISMLHLANEKGLNIRSVPDMSDIIIEPGKSSSLS